MKRNRPSRRSTSSSSSEDSTKRRQRQVEERRKRAEKRELAKAEKEVLRYRGEGLRLSTNNYNSQDGELQLLSSPQLLTTTNYILLVINKKKQNLKD